MSQIPDSHMHTSDSPDADRDATLDAYIKEAEKRGLSSLTFTDHCDIGSPNPLFAEIPDFITQKKRLITLQQSTDVSLNLGVEIGYQPSAQSSIQSLLTSIPFDTVLLSVHYVDGLDPYDQSLFDAYGIKKALTRYYETMCDAVASVPDFDILAHIDYPFRYIQSPDFDALKRHLAPLLNRIFNTLIKQDKVLEVNTAPYRKDYAINAPVHFIYDQYFKAGGRAVSIGSDAHAVGDLKAGFSEAIDFLKSIGFHDVITFNQSVKHRISI